MPCQQMLYATMRGEEGARGSLLRMRHIKMRYTDYVVFSHVNLSKSGTDSLWVGSMSAGGLNFLG